MEKELLKINIFSIGAAGCLTLFTGVILYYFKESAAPYMRFFLPIPPLSIAAYIFAFNLFKHHNGDLANDKTGVLVDVLSGTLITTLVFFIFTLLLIGIIHYLQRSL